MSGGGVPDVGRVETEILVDHGSFDLLDDGGPHRVDLDPAPSGAWLQVDRNRVTVLSASARHHVAVVAVEAWSHEPPPASGWDEQRAAVVHLDSGTIEIDPLVAAEDTEVITVGPPGNYHVHASVSGRAQLRAMEPTLDPAVEAVGVERWLFRFWPVAPGNR